MKVEPGVGGRGVAVSIERKPHPESHFEAHEMRVEKNDDGTFNIRKHKRLKKHFENSENFTNSYREPETASAANVEEVMQHMQNHFGGGKKKAAPVVAQEPDADDED